MVSYFIKRDLLITLCHMYLALSPRHKRYAHMGNYIFLETFNTDWKKEGRMEYYNMEA
jgi:hypothetical protein